MAIVEVSSNSPCSVAQLLLLEFAAIPNSVDGSFSNRERNALHDMVMGLQDTVGQGERLVQTPIPQGYVRHLSRFLSLWLLTLPLALSQAIGWLTPPTVWAASWALCGIQELGQVI